MNPLKKLRLPRRSKIEFITQRAYFHPASGWKPSSRSAKPTGSASEGSLFLKSTKSTVRWCHALAWHDCLGSILRRRFFTRNHDSSAKVPFIRQHMTGAAIAEGSYGFPFKILRVFSMLFYDIRDFGYTKGGLAFQTLHYFLRDFSLGKFSPFSF